MIISLKYSIITIRMVSELPEQIHIFFVSDVRFAVCSGMIKFETMSLLRISILHGKFIISILSLL